MKKNVKIFYIVCLLFFCLIGWGVFLMRSIPHGFIANYYDNPKWKGEPVFSQFEPDINLTSFEHAIKNANFPQNNVSIVWNGWILIRHTGRYGFTTSSDDGSSVTIDGTLVVDNGGMHSIQEMSGEIFLQEGMHQISINYFNGKGGYALKVLWKTPKGLLPSVLQVDVLFPQSLSRFQRWFLQYPIMLDMVYSIAWLLLFVGIIGIFIEKRINLKLLCIFGTRYHLWIVFFPIVIIRLIFILTYPLNNLGGDTSTYYNMMITGESSLVHASGYPFLMRFLLHNFEAYITMHPAIFTRVLLITQHSIDLAMMMVLYFVIASIYNKLTAGFAVFFYGFSLQTLGTTSAVYPEWLQSGLLIFAFCTAFFALRTSNFKRKMILYAFSFSLFTWCYLVKFNAIVMMLFYVVVFFVDKIRFTKKLLCFAVAAFFAVCNYAGFIILYHHPSTGTYQPTYDRAWVLMTKLHDTFNGQLSADNGIYAKRWLALSAVLPNDYFNYAGPGMFSHMDAVSPKIRSSYRQAYSYLFNADINTLDIFLQQHQLPTDFQLHYSALPIGYYIGLRESEELGIKVFIEAIRAHPSVFLTTVLQQSISDCYTSQDTLIPIVSNIDTFLKKQEDVSWGFFKYNLKQADHGNIPFWYSHPVIWKPGVKLFSFLDYFQLPQLSYTLLIGLIFVVALFQVATHKQVTFPSGIPILLTMLLAIFVVFSNMVLFFRWKEMRFVFPIMSVLSGMSLSWILQKIYTVINMRQRL